MTENQTIATSLSAACLVLASGLAYGASQYGPGVTDTAIKIGNTMPYSGPASAYGAIGKSSAAYFAMINILDGWAAICGDDADRGTELLRKAAAGWQKGGARLWMPMFLVLEAEGHVKAGRAEAALQAIEQALAIGEHGGERWAMAEVLRMKAHILLSTGRAKSHEIEAILLDSLEIARRQQARCWELRTSCDLARLWQGQDRDREALKLLQSLCDKFEEGSDVADLGNARALARCLTYEVTRKPRKRFSARAA